MAALNRGDMENEHKNFMPRSIHDIMYIGDTEPKSALAKLATNIICTYIPTLYMLYTTNACTMHMYTIPV